MLQELAQTEKSVPAQLDSEGPALILCVVFTAMPAVAIS